MSLVLDGGRPDGHPEICLLDFDLNKLLYQVKERYPVLAERKVGIWIVTHPTLVCIINQEPKAAIKLHSVFNHPQTPSEVIAFVIAHELLHLLIPPREVDGVLMIHPPEYRDAERQIPHAREAWGWITIVLDACLKHDARHECIWVKPSWKKLMDQERLTMDRFMERFGCHIPVPSFF